MVHVLAALTIKEGHLAEFIEIFKANVPKVLEEKGCIQYVPTIDVPGNLPNQVSDRNIVTVVEEWETLDDLIAHSKAPHMLAYGEKVKDILVDVSLKILTPA